MYQEEREHAGSNPDLKLDLWISSQLLYQFMNLMQT